MGLSIEQQWIKRAEDLVISALMMILFSPVFLIAAIGIKCTDRGPIFYKQERLTKDGKKFMIYKFRTMIVDAEKTSGPVLATDRDPRILPIGRLLRATRLDELPQIVNILKGEMSVVAPGQNARILLLRLKRRTGVWISFKGKSRTEGVCAVYGKYNTTFMIN